MASREDDLFQQDGREAEVKAAPSDAEFDPYDDLLTNIFHDVLKEPLMSDVNERIFQGVIKLQFKKKYFIVVLTHKYSIKLKFVIANSGVIFQYICQYI